MATPSSTLAWKIPWTEEPGRLQSMGAKSQIQLSNFSFTFLSKHEFWECISQETWKTEYVLSDSVASPNFVLCS